MGTLPKMSAGRRKRGGELSAAYKKSSAEWHQQKEKRGGYLPAVKATDFCAVQDRCGQIGKCGKTIMAQPSAHKNVQKGQVIVKIKLEAKTAEDGQVKKDRTLA